MKKRLVLASLLVAAASVFAGQDDVKPIYGGVVQEIREISYELVAKPDILSLYVHDHGKKLPSAGGTARVTLLNGGEKSEITLAPAGDNVFQAKGAFKVQKGTRAIAVVALAGKAPVTARYEIK
jgi:hypothetical protein